MLVRYFWSICPFAGPCYSAAHFVLIDSSMQTWHDGGGVGGGSRYMRGTPHTLTHAYIDVRHTHDAIALSRWALRVKRTQLSSQSHVKFQGERGSGFQRMATFRRGTTFSQLHRVGPF